MKSISVLIGLSLCLVSGARAQIADDFSDGDFTLDPAWQGTQETFAVNSQFQLQLSASEAGTSWLSTAASVKVTQNISWEFFLRQAFAPSSANFGRVYLMSDQADLSGPLNGYYLQFGEAGSADAVELFRQSGTERASVCRAVTGNIAAAFGVRVKVTRSHPGYWQVEVDYTGGTDYVPEATGEDATHTQASFFGFLFAYTVSNATDFYFDDVKIVTTPAPDSRPPELLAVQADASTSVHLTFSEPVDSVSAHNLLNYFVLPTPGNPVSAVLRDDGSIIELTFDAPFVNGYESTIAIQALADLSGNYTASIEATFVFFEPRPVFYRDVIISEVLADPSPPVALPEAEFVELFNRSEHAVELSGWTLTDGNTMAVLTHHMLLPGSHLVVTGIGNAGKFSSGGVLGVSSFPSLNNAGDLLMLSDPSGSTIDSVVYDLSWYADGEKRDGGWSLERIDPNNICEEAGNWDVAEDAAGGTPGRTNSVFAEKPDRFGPKLLEVVADDPGALIILFDEKLAAATPTPHQFLFTPFIEIHSVSFSDEALDRLSLVLAEDLQPGQEYSLKVSDIYDCPGNIIQEGFSEWMFIVPQKALAGDVVVNEILFNPRPTGVDFVEIYNRSQKTIDIGNWSLRNAASAGGTNAVSVSDEPFLFYPGEYAVFTGNENVLKGEYVMGHEDVFRKTDLPSFNDDAGSVAILDADGAVIDSMGYSDKMHAAFIRDDEGVSLERISYSAPSTDKGNWRSASESSGFATPGYANSNLRSERPLDDGSITIEPEMLRPATSSHDFARIRYHFDRGGLVANVSVLDPEGRTIRVIAENEVLGTEGFFRWDGDREGGSSARMGYYLVVFEIFDAGGMVKTFKKRVAVF